MQSFDWIEHWHISDFDYKIKCFTRVMSHLYGKTISFHVQFNENNIVYFCDNLFNILIL